MSVQKMGLLQALLLEQGLEECPKSHRRPVCFVESARARSPGSNGCLGASYEAFTLQVNAERL